MENKNTFNIDIKILELWYNRITETEVKIKNATNLFLIKQEIEGIFKQYNENQKTLTGKSNISENNIEITD